MFDIVALFCWLKIKGSCIWIKYNLKMARKSISIFSSIEEDLLEFSGKQVEVLRDWGRSVTQADVFETESYIINVQKYHLK